MYRIKARLFNGNNLVGYVLVDSYGIEKRVDIETTKNMILHGQIHGAKIRGNGISLVSAKISELPRINMNKETNNTVILDNAYMRNGILQCNFSLLAKDKDSLERLESMIRVYASENESNDMKIKRSGNRGIVVTGMEFVDFRMICKSSKLTLRFMSGEKEFIQYCENSIGDMRAVNLIVNTIKRLKEM